MHRAAHTNTHRELHHPPAGRKMSFLSADDSIFSPMVQHFYSRPLTKGLNLKKRIVSGKLTNVLYTQGLMSGMKASFWNVTENVVLHDSEHTHSHTELLLLLLPPLQDSYSGIAWPWCFDNQMNNWMQSNTQLYWNDGIFFQSSKV